MNGAGASIWGRRLWIGAGFWRAGGDEFVFIDDFVFIGRFYSMTGS